jgi:hypothetical protein
VVARAGGGNGGASRWGLPPFSVELRALGGRDSPSLT